MKHMVAICLYLVFVGATAFTPPIGPRSDSALSKRKQITGTVERSSKLFASPVGPMARAKKLMDPKEYNRVVEERMKKSNLSREEAEEDYNNFLENPPFYYALEKKEEYYQSLGYKDIFEGMIGEAEKEGKGDEMRERIAKFKLRSKIKASAVLIVAIVGFFYIQTIYNADPEHFLKGGLPDYSIH